MNLSRVYSATNSAGIYIHIPFCDSKCPYCAFYSIIHGEKMMDEYKNALIREFSRLDKEREYSTVYFGGGTPSSFGGERIAELLVFLKNNYNISKSAEITVECNPMRDNTDFFSIIKSAGANRISLGLQSAVDAERRSLGRVATAKAALSNINSARKNGIDNISVDLMLGIPGQTIESLDQSLDFVIENKIPHISCYMLQIEEGTVFYNRKDKLNLPSDDETAEMYEHMCGRLNAAGIIQYEVSNFAVPNFESRHNSSYWELKDYYGFGPSAHSLVNKKRFYYPASIEEFLHNPNVIDDGIGASADEYIMLSLRLTKGFLYEEAKKYGIVITDKFKSEINSLECLGFVIANENCVHLTTKGFAVSNTVIAKIMDSLGY